MNNLNEYLNELAPDRDELIINGDEHTATIIDAELDPINVSFHYDDCVTIDTEKLTYITLTVDNLRRLIELIEESTTIFEDEVR